MSDKFERALQLLGHIYEARPADFVAEEPRVRHIERVFLPTGELKPICGDAGKGLGCPQLWLDSNCEQCREIAGLPPAAVTKRSLMIALVNNMCDIEQMWLDAMYWNFHNSDKEPLNPDPDGTLANAWIENQMQIVSMLARFEPTMKTHEGRFGWPEHLEAADSTK